MNVITIPEIRFWLDKHHRNVHGKTFHVHKSDWTVQGVIRYRTISYFTPWLWAMIEITYSR